MDKKEILTGTFWSTFEKWGDQFINLAIYIILARALSPTVFGVVAIALSLVIITQTVIQHGFNEALIQKKNIEDGHADTIFWFVFCISSIISLLIYLLSNKISLLFDIELLSNVLKYFSIIIVISSVSTVKISLLKREFRFRELALRQIIVRLISGFFALFLIYKDYTIDALVYYYLSLYILDFAILYKLDGWRPSFSFNYEYFKELFSFGISNTGLRTLSVLSRKSVDVIIGYLLGPEITGLFNVSYNLILKISNLIDGVLSNVIFPVFSRYQEDIINAKRLFESINRYIIIITLPIITFIVLFNQDIVNIAFGIKWVKASNILGILSFLIAFRSLESVSGQLIKSFGYPNRLLRIKLIDVVIKILTLVVLSHFGLDILSIGFVLTYIFMLPFYMNIANNVIGFSYSNIFKNLIYESIALILLLILFNIGAFKYVGIYVKCIILLVVITTIIYRNINKIKLLGNAFIKE